MLTNAQTLPSTLICKPCPCKPCPKPPPNPGDSSEKQRRGRGAVQMLLNH